MKFPYKRFFVPFLLISYFWSCAPKQEPKTIYLVRHAEKHLTGDDPELSYAGSVRALKLKDILEGREIAHVFGTDFRRIRDTAKPLMEAKGLNMELYDVNDHDSLVKELRKRKGNILVVGHSNSIPSLVNYFVPKGEEYEDLLDEEYNFIFEVRLEKDGSARVSRNLFKDY